MYSPIKNNISQRINVRPKIKIIYGKRYIKKLN